MLVRLGMRCERTTEGGRGASELFREMVVTWSVGRWDKPNPMGGVNVGDGKSQGGTNGGLEWISHNG